MKREEFLRRVSQMCGPAEVEAILELAATPAGRRRDAAVRLGDSKSDQGLTDFLTSLIEDDLLDDLAVILPGGTGRDADEAEELLKRLWARLLLLVTPEAKDVLYAHNQLRLMAERKTRGGSSSSAPTVERAYRTALENARAVLSATEEEKSQLKVPAELETDQLGS
jgi:hypothetical protein